jgi:hypothetical protein
MTTIRTDPNLLPWTVGTETYGSAALYQGRPILESKKLERPPQ